MTINLPSGKYILVTVPVDASDIQLHKIQGISDCYCITLYSEEPFAGTERIYLPPGQYELIGLAKEISEEGARGIVEKANVTGNELLYMKGVPAYKDYIDLIKGCWYNTAIASLSSLLKSKGLELERTVVLKIK